MAANDLVPQLSRIRAANPEVILCWTVAPSGVVFMKNARQLGMQQISCTASATWYRSTCRWPEMLLKEPCSFLYASLSAGNCPTLDPAKKMILNYITEYKAKYGSDPDVYGAEAYDGMLMAFRALEAADSFDKETIRSALEHLEFIGTNGLYKFTPQKHYGLQKEDAVVMGTA